MEQNKRDALVERIRSEFGGLATFARNHQIPLSTINHWLSGRTKSLTLDNAIKFAGALKKPELVDVMAEVPEGYTVTKKPKEEPKP